MANRSYRPRSKRPRKRNRGKRRPLITVEIGEEGIILLDTCCQWLQQTADDSRKVTRSFAIREAIQALADNIHARNTLSPEVTAT